MRHMRKSCRRRASKMVRDPGAPPIFRVIPGLACPRTCSEGPRDPAHREGCGLHTPSTHHNRHARCTMGPRDTPEDDICGCGGAPAHHQLRVNPGLACPRTCSEGLRDPSIRASGKVWFCAARPPITTATPAAPWVLGTSPRMTSVVWQRTCPPPTSSRTRMRQHAEVVPEAREQNGPGPRRASADCAYMPPASSDKHL